jgi:peroxiredoxin Q/BCP
MVEACDFRGDRADYEAARAVALGVSSDSVASHREFADKFGLPSTLLTNPDKEVIQAYGVWKEKTIHGKSSMGGASGRPS